MNTTKLCVTTTLLLLMVACTNSTHNVIEERSLIDFFLPIPITTPLVGEGETWGKSSVMPRDTTNGLEDASLQNWCYWDGNILKGDDGKYHMYASRWGQQYAHGIGWTVDSKGVHAVSDSLLGKYIDKGIIWKDWKGGKGANVIGLLLDDGRYATVTSEITKGEVFVSDTPNGTFELLGEIEIDNNGFYDGWTRYNELNWGAVKGGSVGYMANVMIFKRHDGRYMIISRYCVPLISESGILGPYKAWGKRAWEGIEEIPQFMMEDPTMWYSNGVYHIVVNHHNEDCTYHLTSEDGIDNWKYRGVAFSRERSIFKYTDGTVNNWYTVQRPTAYVEDGNVKAFNFSVIDVHKGEDRENDNHGSKIVVVPFDHEGFGKYITSVVEQEYKEFAQTPLPTPWQWGTIGNVAKGASCGYDTAMNTQRMMASGTAIAGSSDALPYVYQKMSGDISLSTLVMSQDLTQAPVAAGLMIRGSLDSDAKSFIATLSNDQGLVAMQRNEVGEAIGAIVERSEIKAPYWLRIEKRGDLLELHISSSNRLNWEKVVETKLPLGESFYVGTTATNRTNEGVNLARFKMCDAHIWGEPTHEGVVSHTFPEVIPCSGKITFDITYENRQALDYYMELENIETGEKYPSKLIISSYKPKGTHHVTYETGKPLAPNSQYWFTIKAVPMHYHDSEAVQSSFMKVRTQP